MKFFLLVGMCLILFSCTDYAKVKKEAYQRNNPHAKELLLNGFNKNNSEYIDTETINRALEGNEESKEIIYAQMDMLKGTPDRHHRVIAAPVIINHSRGR